MSPVSPAVRSDLAPTGTLRVGINHGNLVLAQKNPTTGEVKGVAVDMAHELGRRLDVPVELVQYTSAGQMTDALATGAWDVAFLAREPGRAGEIGFTAPHLLIEGTYLVPAGVALRPRRRRRPRRRAHRGVREERLRSLPDPQHQARHAGARARATARGSACCRRARRT